MIAADLHALQVPIDTLRQLPGNPRRGDVDAVAASLQRFGQRKPIVARADGTITAGNHTWQAAKQLGWDRIAVVRVDDDDATASAFALADNRTAELGSYDDGLLLDLIQSIDDKDLLADTGWSDDAVADLLEQIGSDLPDLPPPDEAGEPPAEPLTKPGDVWILGGHRVVCGDATDVLAYDALLGGDKVDCVWTDPPYGVAIVGGNHSLTTEERKAAGGKTIENDALSASELEDLLRAALGAVLAACRTGSAWYVAAPDGPKGIVFSVVLTDLGVWRQTLIWAKDSLVLGFSDYQSRHEPLYYGWTPGGPHDWFGDRSQTTVIEIPRPKRNADHPTMKPVELVTRCLNNSAPRGGLVLDPFGGSGSTLLACEYTGRKGRLIELDPRYVDVICRRWQDFTGAKPMLESSGELVDFTAP